MIEPPVVSLPLFYISGIKWISLISIKCISSVDLITRLDSNWLPLFKSQEKRVKGHLLIYSIPLYVFDIKGACRLMSHLLKHWGDVYTHRRTVRSLPVVKIKVPKPSPPLTHPFPSYDWSTWLRPSLLWSWYYLTGELGVYGREVSVIVGVHPSCKTHIDPPSKRE